MFSTLTLFYNIRNRSRPDERMINMKDTIATIRAVPAEIEQEELQAIAEAIKDPDTRKRIIAILRSSGLLPS